MSAYMPGKWIRSSSTSSVVTEKDAKGFFGLASSQQTCTKGFLCLTGVVRVGGDSRCLSGIEPLDNLSILSVSLDYSLASIAVNQHDPRIGVYIP